MVRVKSRTVWVALEKVDENEDERKARFTQIGGILSAGRNGVRRVEDQVTLRSCSVLRGATTK
jgi:hypothetical protein